MYHLKYFKFIVKNIIYVNKPFNKCSKVTFLNNWLQLRTISNSYRPIPKHKNSIWVSFASPTVPMISKPIFGLTFTKYNSTSETTSNKQSLAEELLTSKISAQSSDKKSENTGSSSTTEKEEKDRTLKALKFTYYAFGIMMTSLGGFLLWSWGSPAKDAFGNQIEDEFSSMPIIQQYIYRTINEAKNMNKMIQEPAREKLLPDPLKEPYFQPPYTLVLELKDVLVHPEWTYETGWRFKKRPGVDFLLQHCAPPHFEIVIYTSEQGFTVLPVIEQLDSNHIVWYKLFKDSTRYVNGKHLKDLNCLNRDLNKVIVIDWDSEAITSKRNQLTLPRWKGNMNDQSLVELAMMLRTISESEVSDVREVLDYYRTYEDPIAAYKENQRAAQERQLELEKVQQSALQAKALTSSYASSFLRRK